MYIGVGCVGRKVCTDFFEGVCYVRVCEKKNLGASFMCIMYVYM